MWSFWCNADVYTLQKTSMFASVLMWERQSWFLSGLKGCAGISRITNVMLGGGNGEGGVCACGVRKGGCKPEPKLTLA